MTSPFDYINAASFTKENMVRGTENDALASKDYNPWITNKAFSFFPDTVLHANEMNRLYDLDKDLQFEYYLHSLRKRKRFKKWPKKQDETTLSLVCEIYKCNKAVAKQYVALLSEEQINELKQKQEKGGVQNGK